MKTYFQGDWRSICWSVVGCFISRHTYNLYVIKFKINMQWATTRLKASMQEHHYTGKCYFFGKYCKVTLHNHTIWFLLSYRIISASVCVSDPRNYICKNPFTQCCFFVLCSTFQLNYHFWYWSSCIEAFNYYVIFNNKVD